jgi:hypothetical protein
MDMKINNKLIVLMCGVLALSSCDQEKDVEPIMDANTKPVITVTRTDEGASSSTINEGDILEFEVATSKWMEGAIDFTIESENLVEGLDYEILSPASIAPYSSSSTLRIEVLSDNFPENDEQFDLRVVPTDIAQNWRLNPSSLEGSVFDLAVKNINPAGAFTVGFLWADDHDDFDIYVLDGAGDAVGDNIYEGATSAFPEITTVLKTDAPDGEYHVTVDPYAVEHEQIDFTIGVGFEDGTSQVFTGTLDLTSEELPTFGDMIALIKIVKSGNSITVTQLIN